MDKPEVYEFEDFDLMLKKQHELWDAYTHFLVEFDPEKEPPICRITVISRGKKDELAKDGVV